MRASAGDAVLAVLDGSSVDDGTACEIGLFHGLKQHDRERKGVVGLLTDLRERYDSAVHWGEITNRLRDWDDGKNHPGYVLARRLKAKADQIWLFTRNFAVPWTNDRASHCTSWGRCAVFVGVRWLGWLADVILAWGGDIFACSRAAGDAVGVASA